MSLRKRFYPLAAPVPPETQAMSRSAERDRDVGFSPSRHIELCCRSPSHRQDAVAAAVSKAAVVFPLVAWLVALLAGAAAFDDSRVPRGGGGGGDLHLPLKWYDDIFKRVGPLLPLVPLFARWAATFLAERAGDAAVKGEPQLQQHQQHNQQISSLASCNTPPAPSPPRALATYVLVAFIRLAVYMVGRGLGSGSQAMADHIFLGASVVAAAHAEAVAGAALLMGMGMGLGARGGGGDGGGVGLARGLRRGGAGDGRGGGGGGGTSLTVKKVTVSVTLLAAMTAAAVAVASAVCLLALQCGDSYFTAAYFHTPRETLVAAFLGLVLCQSITLAWVAVPASRSLGAAVASTSFHNVRFFGAAAGHQYQGSMGAPSSADTVPLTSSVYEMSPA